MLLYSTPWMVLAVTLSSVSNSLAKCHIDNYVASCVLDILEEHIEATAIVNHCHLPLDVTFLVSFQYANSTKHSWKYTFVTANQNERILIPGLLLPVAPHAPVFLYARVPEEEVKQHNSSFITIEASFVAELKSDEWEEAEFLNDTMHIDTTDDCHFMKSGVDPIPWIVGGLFLIGFICALFGGAIYLFRRKKMENDQLSLVTSMEVGLPGAQPYQMEAVSGNTEHKNFGSESQNSENENTKDKSTTEDSVNPNKSENLGFSFGQLKEGQDSYIIGNCAVQDGTLAPVQIIEKEEHPDFQLDGSLLQAQTNVARNITAEESYKVREINDIFPEGEESDRNQIPNDITNSVVTEGPLEDSSDDGVAVGQGARRKVRDVPSALMDTTSSVTSDMQETSSDSLKCL